LQSFNFLHQSRAGACSRHVPSLPHCKSAQSMENCAWRGDSWAQNAKKVNKSENGVACRRGGWRGEEEGGGGGGTAWVTYRVFESRVARLVWGKASVHGCNRGQGCRLQWPGRYVLRQLRQAHCHRLSTQHQLQPAHRLAEARSSDPALRPPNQRKEQTVAPGSQKRAKRQQRNSPPPQNFRDPDNAQGEAEACKSVRKGKHFVIIITSRIA
jgi:hypothetical protein